MPDLSFQVTGAEPVAHGLTPLLHFQLAVSNSSPDELIYSVILQAQIQILSPHRSYTGSEKERLADLFGTPDRWSQTLRNRLWTQTNTTVRQFSGSAGAVLPVQCTYDLNVTATKYFDALEEGDVPLLFLFSGTIFYATPDGRLQVQQISWENECAFRLPVRLWREMMDHHYPNSAWLYLHRDVFDRLHAYKRRYGLPTWEQTIERLLPPAEEADVAAVPTSAGEH